jgi:hypothetical protein
VTFVKPDMSSLLERALYGFNASTLQATGSIPITHTLDLLELPQIVPSNVAMVLPIVPVLAQYMTPERPRSRDPV